MADKEIKKEYISDNFTKEEIKNIQKLSDKYIRNTEEDEEDEDISIDNMFQYVINKGNFDEDKKPIIKDYLYSLYRNYILDDEEDDEEEM